MRDDMLGTMKVFEINIIHGKWIYSLQYKADKSMFSEYSDVMSRMIDSFKTIDFLPYEDPALGIKIKYPSNWTATQEENSVRFTSFQESNADFKDNLLILVDNSGNHSLRDQEFDVNLQPNAINITSPYTTTVAGYPAKGIRTEFLDKDMDRTTTVEDIVTVINHRKYELIFFSEPSTYNIYLPTIQSMINSIKIVNFSFYQNPNLQFNMSFPSDWKIREDADNVKITSAPENQSDTFREYLSVRSPITLSGNYTLDSYLHGLISSLSQLREDLHINRTYSGGHTNFTMLQYNFTSSGEHYNALGVFPVFNNQLYPIFFYAKPTSYESHLPIINYTINSFKGVDFSSYRDHNIGIIKYPSHWLVHENGKKVQFYSPLETNNDIFQEHLDITYGPSDAVNGSLGCYPKGEGAYDLDSESEHKRYTTLGNPVQERESICSYSDGVNNFKKITIFMKSNAGNSSLYALHFYTEASKYESYLPTIKYMINSFKIADVKSYDKFLPFNNTFASIKYPSEWNVTESPSEFVIESPPDAGSVTFIVSAFIPSSNLEEDVAIALNGLKQNITDFKLIKIGSSTPLNHSSYEILYTGGSENTNTSFIERDTFSTSGSLGYEISYLAEADSYYSYLPVIKNMLDSLVIKPTGKSPPNPSGLVFDSPIVDLAVNPLTHKVYLSSDVANRIYVLDESTGRLISNITVKGFPNFVSLHPSANKIFVVSPEFDQIYVINGYSDNVTSIIQVGKNPATLALDPTDYTFSLHKGLLFVTNQNDNNVEIIDASNEESLKNVTVGKWPYGIVVNPVTTKAYVTNYGDDTVSVIDYGFNSSNTLFAKVIATVDVQSSPAGIAVDPYKNHIFVANSGAGDISVINGLNNRVIKNVSVGIFPQFLLFNKNTSELYITESGNNTISVLNMSVLNMSQSEPKPVSISTDGIATDVDTDPINNWIVVSSYDGKSLSFINGSSLHNAMVHVSFNISPPQSGQIKCNGKIVKPNTIAVMDIGTICNAESLENFDFSGWSEMLRNNVREFSQHNFENSTNVSSNNTIMSNNDTIKIQKNSILTANFRHIDSFVDVFAEFGPYISTGTLIAVIVFASLSQYLFRTRRGGKKSDTQDWVMDKVNLITIDASVIVGVLVFLSLEGFSKSQQTQVTLVTANIVFPFAISAIFSVVNHLAFGTRLMVAGFVNLMVSIIIITIIKL
jgi:YVTN family beta-propeller protein